MTTAPAPDAVEVVNNLKEVVKEIEFSMTARQDANLSTPRHVTSRFLRERDEVHLTQPQYDFLCALEPLFAALTTTTHSLPVELVERTLGLVRTALLRHHVLTRLSTVTSISDNMASQYVGMLLNNCRRMPDRYSENNAKKCLHKFVRASYRQQVAPLLLKALKTRKYPLSLNMCFVIAVDFVGQGNPKCPLQWEDISPLFESKPFSDEYDSLVSQLASKLKPWLCELAALPLLR
eukprot:Blabericola_migrator_1__1123@NODE_1288_length_4887_cov_7_457261_g870_i0_p2_GENE_NODE_1288_length_4887_cov_7_457261_g870_i0NODE_1288_length_4887_cov_7_457261_g870_i0_p2_ORF_typecomplete_len235_score24_14CNOT11/PF10155_9/0_024_NODE_1288_length_4887_cov_7_457261_g870_i035644268